MSDEGGWLRSNVGTVVGWCLTVLAVASFAGTLYADVNHMASEVADNKKRLERYEERLRPVETLVVQLASLREDLRQMRSELAEIRRLLLKQRQ